MLLTACQTGHSPLIQEGPWRAWLDSPGGDLPFGLEIHRDGDGLSGFLVNGAEKIEVPRIALTANRLVVSIEHYDAVITATLSPDGRRLEGAWEKTAGPDERSHLAFHATAGLQSRFAVGTSSTQAAEIDGRWAVDFESDDDTAIALFERQPDGSIHGTFMTATGDYRFLAGSFDNRRLRLSVFDGAHAFLFDARLRDDGTLAGDFWSRDTWHETWTARRDDDVKLPNPFDQTRWTEGADLSRAVFPDLEGNLRSLADPEFAGRARILEVFGSWCPNCNDATSYLGELHRRYADRGLSIVGLAFEMTGDFERDAQQVRTYADYHGIEFPLLLAGLSDKDEASRAFPLIDRVRSFPTTIFLHGDGRVRAVHTGYSGPATGHAHQELRSKFESLIEELLASEPAPAVGG